MTGRPLCWTIFPEHAAQLPADELALLVLADRAATGEENEYNYGNRYRHCFGDLLSMPAGSDI